MVKLQDLYIAGMEALCYYIS